jgi:hypothetical protein
LVYRAAFALKSDPHSDSCGKRHGHRAEDTVEVTPAFPAVGCTGEIVYLLREK